MINEQPPAGTALTTATPVEERRVLKLPLIPGLTELESLTRGTLRPTTGGARVVDQLTHRNSDLDITTVARELTRAAEVVADGNLTGLQMMLATQARTLDLVFYSFAVRAGNATTEEGRDQCLRLALKAQSQSRSTVESLAAIQHGPAIFARNANINHGQQQVNNGVPAPAGAATAPAPAPVTEPRTLLPPARMRARKNKVAHPAKRTIGVRQ